MSSKVRALAGDFWSLVTTKTFFACGSCDTESIEIFPNQGKTITIVCRSCENLVTLCPNDVFDNLAELTDTLGRIASDLTLPSEEMGDGR